MLDTGFKRHCQKKKKREKNLVLRLLTPYWGFSSLTTFLRNATRKQAQLGLGSQLILAVPPGPSRRGQPSAVEAERTVLALHQKEMYWMLQSRTRRTKLLVPARTAILWMCEMRLVSESLSSLPLCLSFSICENGRNSVSPTRSL